MFSAILDAAVRDRRITSSPASDAKTPRKVAKPRVNLNHTQVERLAAASLYPELIRVLAYTGLRWGEATGLRLKHLDRRRRRIKVVENAVNVGGKVVVGTPKSHAQRLVPYPAFLDSDFDRICAGKNEADLVWTGRGGGYLGPGIAAEGWFERVSADHPGG